jgi:hypothetical protein
MADNADWRESLPDELKTDPALKDFKDVASVAKSLVETKKLVGGSIRPPGPDAGPEARKEFVAKLREKMPELLMVPADPAERATFEDDLWRTLGRPEKPEDYSLEGVTLEEGVKLDEVKLRELGKSLKLTKAQLREAANLEATGQAAQLKATKEARAQLRSEFGDEYQAALNHAATVAEKKGFAEDAVALRAGLVSAARAKAWVAEAKRVTGPGNPVGQQGQGAPPDTTAELLARRAEMMARTEYFNPAKGREVHLSLVEKVRVINEELDRRRSA